MAKRASRPKRPIATAAYRDLVSILNRSIAEFGREAALRYNSLIMQATDDVLRDPNRLGSKEHPGLLAPGLRTYHIELSRSRTPGRRVQNPRHFLLYRQDPEGRAQVLRILHDARSLAESIPAKYLAKP